MREPTIQMTHVIFYVKQVEPLLEFYSRALGLEPKMVHESGDYAELVTGSTTLAFASHELASSNLPEGFEPIGERAPACEICLMTEDVDRAYEVAVQEGATPIQPPEEKPWGDRIGYIRDPEGILLALGKIR